MAQITGLQAIRYGSAIANSFGGQQQDFQPQVTNMNPQLAASMGYMPQGMAQQYQPGGYGGVQYGGAGYGYPQGGVGYGFQGQGGMGGYPGGVYGGGIMPPEQAQAQMWAAQTGYTGVYAQVESGPPIIINPETGEPYPPGFTPTVQNPYTWDLYQPFEKIQEAKQLHDAEKALAQNKALENTLGKWEGQAAEQMLTDGRKRNQELIKESEKLGNDPAGYLKEKIQGLTGGTTKPGGSKAGTTTPQNPKEYGQQLGQQTAQGIQSIGTSIQSGIRSIAEFGQGFASGAGLINEQVNSNFGGGVRSIGENFRSNFPVQGPQGVGGWGTAQTSQGASIAPPTTGIRTGLPQYGPALPAGTSTYSTGIRR